MLREVTAPPSTASIEATIGATVVITAAPALPGSPPLIVGGFPAPGHFVMTPPNLTAQRLTLNQFAR